VSLKFSLAVIGAGAWGMALANSAARANCAVTLITRSPQDSEKLCQTRASPQKLPGVTLHDSVMISSGYENLQSYDAILMVVPAQATRAVLSQIPDTDLIGKPVILCSKGLEQGTGLFQADVLKSVHPKAIAAVLSGPSFAADVARGLPTAVTLACKDTTLAVTLAENLGSPLFRIYHSEDVMGVEIGGAVKNVLAIAAGMVEGKGLGASAKAALIARAFAELSRFASRLGANPTTLAGLSGLGDLVLTCSSPQSRNYQLGYAIGQAGGFSEALMGQTLSEGYYTAEPLAALALKLHVDMPIAQAVAAVLKNQLSVDEAIAHLMARPQKAEREA
jgi:glycerol-3-phosphate dehydrogenase (NAD(P)+)